MTASRIFLRRTRHTVVSPGLKRNLNTRPPFCTAATNFDIAAVCTELVCFIVHGNQQNAHFSNECFNSIRGVFYMFRTSCIRHQEDNLYILPPARLLT